MAHTAISVIPSARRLVQSLRDLGYDFVHAVADLGDNSVTARASKIAIEIRFDGADSWIKIADNGTGMTAETLNEAMRYGSERKYEADELGKFGLGLKTASTSQCRRLTVVSRADPERRRFEGRILDLDHIEKTNRWEVHRIEADEMSENLTEPIKDSTGTVVLWECLDRVLNYKLPWGDRAKNGLLTMAERLDQHLGMVFHQYLDGTAARRKKLAITINGTIVEAWDPFATAEKDTEKLTEEEFEITGPAGKGTVKYRPFVLPVKEKFSSDTAFNRAGGPERWNRQQGFYIYRAGRLIQSGGWSWMRTADEHTKLARAAIEFYPDLDSAFGINVAKMRVSLPAELREKLKIPVERLAKRSRDVYDRKNTMVPGKSGSFVTATTTSGGQVHERTAVSSGRSDNSSESEESNGKPQVNTLRAALELAAQHAGEQTALEKIATELKKERPEVARELGW
jgi:hypothetical protein